ncbi:hypothetical protein N7470_009896 [Penicillium chermesinum]|nr:hypothetical protein N7470_009896 [Penicillium chermesinum]
MANDFADWIVRDDGGQQVIRDFKKNGQVLYSTIPEGVDPLDRIKGVLGVSGRAPPQSGSSGTIPPQPGSSGTTPPQPGSAGSNKAAVPLSWSTDEIYFFKDRQYVRINTVWDTIDKNAKDVWSMWPALKDLEFTPINAIFSAPENKIDAYFFCGSRCARLNTQTGQLADDGGPFNFQEKWPCLKDLGFDLVDAAMSFGFKGPESASVICFFRKETYALVDVNQNFLVEAGHTALRFNALAKANFKTIDAVVFKPRRGEREAYFFSGSQYALVDLIGDKIAWGPVNVDTMWRSLKTVGFY